MTNPLRGPDAPYDPFVGRLIDEEKTSTKHPSRFEPTQSTLKQTQTDAITTAIVNRTAAVSLATGALVSWDTEETDEDGLWNGSTTFTIPSTGKNTGPWLFHVKVTWPGTGAGTNRQIDIMRNGSPFATMQGPTATTGQEISKVIYNPNTSDTFTVRVTHDAGGSLAMTVGPTNMFFEVHHPW